MFDQNVPVCHVNMRSYIHLNVHLVFINIFTIKIYYLYKRYLLYSVIILFLRVQAFITSILTILLWATLKLQERISYDLYTSNMQNFMSCPPDATASHVNIAVTFKPIARQFGRPFVRVCVF